GRLRRVGAFLQERGRLEQQRLRLLEQCLRLLDQRRCVPRIGLRDDGGDERDRRRLRDLRGAVDDLERVRGRLAFHVLDGGRCPRGLRGLGGGKRGSADLTRGAGRREQTAPRAGDLRLLDVVLRCGDFRVGSRVLPHL